MALDASTGKVRWTLPERYREPELLYGSKATIVVGTADGEALLTRATGREVAGPTRPCCTAPETGPEP